MPRKILIASLKHETNTFSKLPTDIAAYEARTLYRGQEVIDRHKGTRVEVAAFLDAAETYGWEIVTPISASATPSGRVTEEAFETFASEIMASLKDEGPFDAVLLALHGAMVTTHDEDGEGLLLERVRAYIGPDIPLGVSLDLHANFTDRMAANADVLVSFRTYPHIDGYETAEVVANLTHGMLERGLKPKTYVARGQMLDGVDHGRTTSPGPMLEVLALADAHTAREADIHTITVNAGFPWTDIHDVGPTVVVVGEGNNPRHQEIANELVGEIWTRRADITIDPMSTADAIARAKVVPAGEGAVVLADFADNPGGGGYNDSTKLLAAMIEAGFENAAFSNIYDPAVTKQALAAGIGTEIDISLGGKTETDFAPPIVTKATVKATGDGKFHMEGPMAQGSYVDMWPCVLLDIGGIDVVVTQTRLQVLDRQYFRHLGINPEDKDFLGVKSAQHFRAAFAPIAREILVVDEGDGITSRNYPVLPYKNVRRPVWPLDLD